MRTAGVVSKVNHHFIQSTPRYWELIQQRKQFLFSHLPEGSQLVSIEG